MLGHSNLLEEKVMQNLSDGIRNQLILEKNAIILKTEMLKNFSQHFVSELSSKFREQIYGSMDIIINEGEQGSKIDELLYFMIRGKILFFNEKTQTTFHISK